MMRAPHRQPAHADGIAPSALPRPIAARPLRRAQRSRAATAQPPAGIERRAPAPDGSGAARRAAEPQPPALLALSVLADSAIEHYRGSFHNQAMYHAARRLRR